MQYAYIKYSLLYIEQYSLQYSTFGQVEFQTCFVSTEHALIFAPSPLAFLKDLSLALFHTCLLYTSPVGFGEDRLRE